jgi:hypothetical protein
MILDIFKDCFEYSFKEPKTIIKLGVLSVLSSLIFIPYFFISGYYYRIIKIGVNGMINGDDPLPEFNNWLTMFLDGIKIFIVRFVYFIPGVIVYSLGSAIVVLFSIQTVVINVSAVDSIYSFIPTLFVIFGVISISAIVWLIFYLLSNVAIPHMINEGSFMSIFKINEIIAIIKSIGVYKYLQFYLGCIVLFLGIISATFLFFALIGSALGLMIAPAMGPLAMGFPLIFMIITSSIALYLFLNPFFMIFEGRAIALMYNTREV